MTYTIAFFALARPTFDVGLAQEIAQTALNQLTEAGYRVIGPGARLVMDAAAVEAALADWPEEPCDLAVLLQASFADSAMAQSIARAMHAQGIPLLLWAVPEARTGGRLRLNSLCGVNLAAHALARQGIPYDYLFYPAGDEAALAKVDSLARAGYARRILAECRIGLLGQHPPGFDTCAYDQAELARTLGSQVVPIPLAQVLQAAAQVPPAQRQEALAHLARWAPNLDELDARATAGTAGVYAALRELATARHLDGLAVRCWPEFFTELGCAACGAMSALTEEAVPCSCEADVHGTLTLVLLQAISGERPFIADLVDVDVDDDSAVLWHCGLAPPSMADPAQGIQGTVHSNRGLPLLFQFALKPGRVTLARLHHLPGQGYRLVVGGGAMLSAAPSFSGTSGVIRFDRPAREVLDRVLGQGLEHHLCLVYGEHRPALAAWARLMGLPMMDLTAAPREFLPPDGPVKKFDM
ncbi:MAG: fucose isomerase [Litorilinea sp.]|nr:MAG: fucose isomerase [Litorilinea sp.]